MRTLSILFILFILLAGCDKRQAETVENIEKPIEKIPVRITTVESSPIVERLSVRGEVAPLWSVDIYADGAGKIISKNADVGDRIEQNQVVAQMKQDIPGMEFSPSPIESPVNGTITVSMIEIGSMVSPQRPVYTISQLDSVLVLARVLEPDLPKISAKATCQISADAVPGKTFSGRVRQINPLIDPRSKTVTVEVALANHGALLKPGMSVTCNFAQSSRTALTLPLDAVSRSGIAYSIVKILGDRATILPVQTGTILEERIEVSGAIAEGDSVVVYGQNLLQDGSLVEIVE